MCKRSRQLLRKVRANSGATLVEYALILVIVSIVAVIILSGIGGHTNNMLASVNNGFGP
jgi:Flp pilus assembly pilin Flp